MSVRHLILAGAFALSFGNVKVAQCDPPKLVGVCDVLREPSKFDGRSIVVSAEVHFGRHRYFMYSDLCKYPSIEFLVPYGIFDKKDVVMLRRIAMDDNNNVFGIFVGRIKKLPNASGDYRWGFELQSVRHVQAR